ncbi:MAG: DUF4012 domain-containing protein [Patescibacteria group bacterium]
MSHYFPKILSAITTLLKYIILAGAAFILLILIALGSAYHNLKNAAENGFTGRKYLSAAVDAVQRQDWPAAKNQTADARDSFISALENLEQTKTNVAIKYISPIRQQINDLEYLLKTAEILSRSLARVLPLAQELDDLRSGTVSGNFSDLPENDKKKFLQLIYESEPELNGLRANLELAILNLDKIHRLSLLWPIYAEISDIKQELQVGSLLMTKLSPIVKLLPALTGYPSASRFLIVLQNNDELRPTGGFIGTYGLMEIKNGQLFSLKTDDSYHLDMPASLSDKWQTKAPEILKKYLKVEKWYLRDANWSPDWPSAAQKIQEIYNGEATAIGQEALLFTGIIAINPDLIADLLKLVGPIELRGASYRFDNLQQLLQYNVEVAYKEQNISAWDRKEIINELMTEIKNRLFRLESARWNQLFKILDHNINTKNIQIYFNAATWETLAQNIGLSGEIKNPASDYLLVVDANLGAFKSDAVMKKTIEYNVTETNTGLQTNLKLNYRHEGGFDWRTTRYRSYTRIYAPLGSRLISIDGLDSTQANLSVVDDKNLNKTVFGFFWTIEPGKFTEININYNLPNRLKTALKENGYELLVQKQSGQRLKTFKASFKSQTGKREEWTSPLESDQNFTTATLR